MGTDQNLIQGTIVRAVAMMGALGHSTLNALVCVAVHKVFPPFLLGYGQYARSLLIYSKNIPNAAL